MGEYTDNTNSLAQHLHSLPYPENGGRDQDKPLRFRSVLHRTPFSVLPGPSCTQVCSLAAKARCLCRRGWAVLRRDPGRQCRDRASRGRRPPADSARTAARGRAPCAGPTGRQRPGGFGGSERAWGFRDPVTAGSGRAGPGNRLGFRSPLISAAV